VTKLKCPECGARLRAHETRIVCSKCGALVRVADALKRQYGAPAPSEALGPQGSNPFNKIFLVAAIAVIGYAALYRTIAALSLVRGHPLNESGAADALEAVHAAQKAFRSEHERYGSIDELRRRDSAGESPLSLGVPDGYHLEVEASQDHWAAVAVPIQPGESGARSFYIDESGVIRAEEWSSPDDRPASILSPPLER
jgi:hypothetical protein